VWNTFEMSDPSNRPLDRTSGVSPSGFLRRTKVAAATVVLKAKRYGRYIVTGHFNLGYCTVCEKQTVFVETGPVLRADYRCVRCDSVPRWRALIQVLNTRFPDWKRMQIHECGMGGPATRRLRRDGAGYTGSRFIESVAPGTPIMDGTCQDIEALTFADNSFDIFVTQDVLEHVLRPDRAMKEIARVLKPGGSHVYTVPVLRGRKTVVRVAATESGAEHLLPDEYHGEPGDPERSLVITDWGDDFPDFVSNESGLSTEALPFHDRKLGLDGQLLEVFISTKQAL
jgi:SAM-dependent methyltransferase